MSIFSRSTSNWMLSVKLFLLSTGVLLMAVMLKLSVPAVREFAISEVPSIWSLLSSWLRPPYLYLVINCIIISIVASSKFQQKVDESPPEPVVRPVSVKTSGEVQTDFAMAYGVLGSKDSPLEVRPEFGHAYEANVANALDLEMYGHVNARAPETKTTNSSEHLSDGDELPLPGSSSTPNENSREDSLYTEKPLVSARFGHRKAVKANPEGGRTLGVAKPKRHDTLESTWKTITEGRQMPLTRHLRKADTWETQGRHSQYQTPNPQRMAKSEAFNEHRGGGSNNLSPGSGKLRKESSPSQDELNRRVEAFIKKFNEDMRLQRQESLNRYVEMINRGSN